MAEDCIFGTDVHACICICVYTICLLHIIHVYTPTHLCHSVYEGVVALDASVPGGQTVGFHHDVAIVSAANEKLWQPG